MVDIQWKNITVESLGTFELTLPVGTVGTGNPPFVSLISLLHGDETIGLLILHRLIHEFVPRYEFQGTIRLIPVANPLAALTQTRISCVDRLDMNRIGIGNSEGQITERVANYLYEIIKDSVLVLNFHELETDSVLTCVDSNSGSQLTRKQILKGILTFEPDVIWSVPLPTTTEITPIQSFDSMTAQLGTPIFSIEFARSYLIKSEMIETYLFKIEDILKAFGVVKTNKKKDIIISRPKAVRRRAVYSPTMGIWMPKIDLMNEVNQGQVIGTLAVLPDFSEVAIKSPEKGVLIQVRTQEVIKANSIVFAVGTPDGLLEDEIDSLMFSLE